MGEKRKAVTNNKGQAPKKRKKSKKLNLDNKFFVASKPYQDDIITPFKPV